MPLPKSASIAARATDVYSEVCSLIMKYLNGGPFHTEIPLLLPYLRQLLTCCACAGLLNDPLLSLACGHCYCYKCQFGEPLMKIHCRQCRQREGLIVNTQLKIIAKLYRELIHVLAEATPTDHALQELVTEVVNGIKVSKSLFLILPPERYRKLNTPTIKPTKPKITKTLLKDIEPVMGVACAEPVGVACKEPGEELLQFTEPLPVASFCIINPLLIDISNRGHHFTLMEKRTKFYKTHIKEMKSIRRHYLTPSLYRRSPTQANNKTIINSPLQDQTVSLPLSLIKTSKLIHKHKLHKTPLSHHTKKTNKKKKKMKTKSSNEYILKLSKEEIEKLHKEAKYSCRCGTNPGVLFGHLICLKKKCPCYFNGIPCIKCRCRGCCNPYRVVPIEEQGTTSNEL